MEDAVIGALQRHGELDLRGLTNHVDGTIAEVFKSCRDLEREGKVVTTKPLTYNLREQKIGSQIDGQRSAGDNAFIWSTNSETST